MTKLTIAAKDWVVVCDGRKALICQNAGDEKFLNLKVIE
jgi:protein required for attachment to host cells